MHFYQAVITTAALTSASLTSVSAQASQNISSLMIEIRQQDGISFYYSIANGMTLNGDVTIVRDNQGYTVGQFSQGVPNGRWQVFLPNNQKLLDGQYAQGYQDGQWQLFDSSGNLSEKQYYRQGGPDGVWEQYNLQGNVDQTTLYKEGQKVQVERFFVSGKRQALETYLDNLRHGVWETYHENGTVALRQEYANNHLSGRYLEQNSAGKIIVEGEYNTQGERQGAWRSFYDDGTPNSEIHFEAGIHNGKALSYFPSGQLAQQATYKNNHLDGESLRYHENGHLYEKEHYQDGQLEGLQVIYNADQVVIAESNFKLGTLAGEQKSYFDDGKLKQLTNYHTTILADNGQYPLHGIQEQYDSEGRLVEKGNFKQGVKDGLFTRYRQGEMESEENWLAGERHSKQTRYYATDKLRSIDHYEHGKQTGRSESYFDDGTLKERGTRLNSVWIGKYESFYETGLPREVIHYASTVDENTYRAKFHGHYARWFGNGDPSETGEYIEGKKTGEWLAYNQGLVTRKQTYLDGKLNGEYAEYYNGRRRVTGLYQDNMKTGVWTGYRYQESDPTFGTIAEGNILRTSEYANNKLHGKREYFDFKQIRYRSESYVKGVQTGPYAEYYVTNGQLKRQGEMIKNVQTGLWQGWFEDGMQSFSSELLAGQQHGEHREYYANGQLKQHAQFEKGKLNGLLTQYYQTGKQEYQEQWLKGQKEGEASYFHTNGKLAEKGSYLRERKEGLWLNYWPNGEKRSEGSYISNRQSGDWVYYDQFGKLIKTEHH
ncbi:hypothetical protein OTK51_18400 [Vibrio scophthalmi]|uniref:toxin-antitoxin system YwqK family antitoxin n=1 Tax=Vibrio scophthalmi TaxID=45658 RepID=UPI002283E02C|nr:toxin-antitoxin system YwqK family antitoxin [Vibrio scophthalmi]MCY9805399.1 hypothetical protein [Vibrio scophthalmi]